ncbi:MAG: hypothetical protein ABH865_03320 [Candidatus Omnitrophota bacterium]|nr:DUF4145 domain-containing protein [Candidatus Omnitrophota bacterium]
MKKELFKKIRKYHEFIKERSEMEDNSDLPIPELFDSNDEYAGLCVQAQDTQDDIDKLLIEFKDRLIDGLTPLEFKELDFFLKSSDLGFDQNIEQYQQFRFLIFKEEEKRNLKKVKRLRLLRNVDVRTSYLYNEAIRCYTNSAFNASCVLCRAIAENIIKVKSNEPYGKPRDLLKKIRNSKLTRLYSEIAKKANRILHHPNEKTKEEDALKAVVLLQDFISESTVVRALN